MPSPAPARASHYDLAAHTTADLAAHGLSKKPWLARLRYPVVAFQLLLRQCEAEAADPSVLPFRARWLNLRFVLLSQRLGYTIPRGVFGPGLSIAHRGTIVVNSGARVGRNCRIHQGVTIGQLYGQHPVIGDNVWIGPGAVISGGVRIGSDSVIGANAVVTRDVLDGTTVGGVPARVISDQASTRLLDRDHPGEA